MTLMIEKQEKSFASAPRLPFDSSSLVKQGFVFIARVY